MEPMTLAEQRTARGAVGQAAPGHHDMRLLARPAGQRGLLLEAMWAAPALGWRVVPGRGLIVRWDREAPTPAWAREPGAWDWRSDDAAPLWADPTCPQSVFVTLIAPAATPILGLWRAPWVVRVDQSVTVAEALAVLADPAAALDGPVGHGHGASGRRLAG